MFHSGFRKIGLALALALSAAHPAMAMKGSAIGPAYASPWRHTVQILVEHMNDRSPEQIRCTGTILASDIILTARHCIPDTEQRYIEIQFLENGTKLVDVRKFARPLVHPLYTKDTYAGQTSSDLAVLHFKGGLPNGFFPAQILHSPELLAQGSMNWIAGYGVTAMDMKDAGTLRYGFFTIDRIYSTTEVALRDPEQKFNLCKGDSGSPVFLPIGKVLFFWGVVHGMTGNCTGEGRSFVSSYFGHADWIRSAVEQLRAQADRS